MAKITHLKDLRPDPQNARAHNPRNVGMIVDALQEVGAARSGVIDEEGRILAGNATWEALAEAGIERVRVVEADGNEWVVVRRAGLTEEQKKRLALYDNRTAELAEWDAEVLAGILADDGVVLDGLFYDDELVELLGDLLEEEPPEDPGPQMDRAAELQEKWQTARGQLWFVGRHRLLCGDALNPKDVERLLDGAKPNLMVTDPPYGVEYDANWRNEAAAEGKLAYAARRTRAVVNDDRIDWSDAYLLFPGNVAYTWSPGGDHVILTGLALQKAGFEIRNQIIWCKPHFPISRGHYTYQHEPVWYGVRRDKKADWVGPANESTKWEIALDKNVEGGHSTQKPVECMQRPIRNHKGDVYDPFVGSGTTLVAAENESRSCYAMDIDPAYVSVVLERMARLGLEPRLVSDQT